MKNRHRSLLLFFVFTVLGGFNLSSLLGRPIFENMRGGDVAHLIGTIVMFGLAILCLKEYFFGRRSS
ncbi:hypothetical protein Slin_3647 [Spirosoma linguale DSM 74]|uniref:Uncharacterized protein n=1 Tax=Spirosoma linguale (strain ATCC 33905 / DSM 74 / LMG 10896 / Claus 1) TaxID=504472 RepID=D2QRA0_SPILD|nr:hypothetical protein Slin_3647 [Spirosoma linguale DSM 74]